MQLLGKHYGQKTLRLPPTPPTSQYASLPPQSRTPHRVHLLALLHPIKRIGMVRVDKGQFFLFKQRLLRETLHRFGHKWMWHFGHGAATDLLNGAVAGCAMTLKHP